MYVLGSLGSVLSRTGVGTTGAALNLMAPVHDVALVYRHYGPAPVLNAVGLRTGEPTRELRNVM